MPVNTMYKIYIISKKYIVHNIKKKTGKTEKKLEKLLSQEKLGCLPSLWKSSFSSFFSFSECLPKVCSETKLGKLKKNWKNCFLCEKVGPGGGGSIYIYIYQFILLQSTFMCMPYPVGGFNPIQKYAHQLGSFPQLEVSIKYLWNHHHHHHLAYTHP